MAISPKGVLSRSIWNFYPSQIMAGFASTAGNPAQLTYISLFNNDQGGNYLWVIGCSVTITGNDDVVFEIIPFNPGGAPSTFPPGPLVTNAPLLAGLLTTFTTAACLGQHTGGAANATVSPFTWPHDWPIAIIAPGQAFALTSKGFNQQMDAGLWWWSGPQP